MLSQALLAGASGQLRNLATVGGNLLQRTRCSYFQDVTKPCNKRRPGSGCPAREGEHRNLAILGHSEHCVATHPSDMAVALTALGATVHVHGTAGARASRCRGSTVCPATSPQRDTNLDPGDLITAVELPAPDAAAARSTYRKVRERASFSFAVISVAAAVERARRRHRGVPRSRSAASPTCRGGRPRPRRRFAAAPAAPERASPPPPTPSWRRAEPLRDNAYKVPLTRNVLVNTLDGAVRVTGTALTPAVGAPLSRVEGREKVTGQAQYAYEQPVEGVAYAVGRHVHHRRRRDREHRRGARRSPIPGVLAVISHENAPRLAEVADGELRLLQSASVAYRGQIVAAVVAESLEAAREAAAAVRVEYDAAAARRRAAPRPPGLLQAREGQPELPDRRRARRPRRRPRGRRGRRRRDLHDPAAPQQPDGAAREPRRLGRRRPHALRLDPGHLGRAPRHRRGVRARARARAGDLPPRRRRLRLQGHAAAAGRARRRRRADRRAAGQARPHAPAAVLHRRLPHADDPARAARRRARRPAAGDRPRRVRADLDRARVRRADHRSPRATCTRRPTG